MADPELLAEGRGERVHYAECPADGMAVDVGRLLSDIDPCECRAIFARRSRSRVTEIVVTSCARCPWEDAARCEPPPSMVAAVRRGVIDSRFDGTPPPEDCPLRAGPVVVRIGGGR